MKKEVRITGKHTGVSKREYRYMVSSNGDIVVTDNGNMIHQNSIDIRLEDAPGLFEEIKAAIVELTDD